MGLDNSLPALRALIILAQWTGKLPTRTDAAEHDGSSNGTHTTNGNGHPHSPTEKASDEGKDEEEDEDYDVAKEGVAFDGEMFLAAAVRISAKMHLELDVQMALANKQNSERPSSSSEQGSATTNGGGPSAAKIAETLDRARVVSRYLELSRSRTLPASSTNIWDVANQYWLFWALDVQNLGDGRIVSFFLFPVSLSVVA